MTPFIGRDDELRGLETLLKKQSASLVVIKGRRRIGKSRLAEEFGKSFTQTLAFSGLPPIPGITSEDQKKEFIRKMREYQIPRIGGDDWGDIFSDLSQKCKKGKLLIIIDEISWMAMNDATFLGKLKNAWDSNFKKNPHLIMILSGSQSTWIETNILNSSGFMGRISYQLTLEELSLPGCNQFWRSKQATVSAYEKLKLLSITGGVPRYLEEIQPNHSAEENIKRLCFTPEGFLFHEFEQIFSDLFSKRSDLYKKIVRELSNGPMVMDDVIAGLDRSKGGDIAESLDDLCQTGFVTRDYTWDIGKTKISKLSQFRLSDNYVRFYLKFIEPSRPKILSGISGQLPPSWLSILGLQFENLVIGKKNRIKLFACLNIPLHEIVMANPFFQTVTKSRRGCQIDFMIQTKFNTLYLCEVKFESGEIQKSIINDIKEKMDRLEIPKNFSIRPVLIHVNGIHHSIIESDFFSQIIDFGDLL